MVSPKNSTGSRGLCPGAAGDQFDTEPAPDCALCPRLVSYRDETADQFPEWFNGAVPSFGDANARLLVVGLAPGVKGANRTGRPFTGDYAGDLLYATLTAFGWTRGSYAARPDDGLELLDCMITNAVRCVPPANKPTPQEIATCRGYFRARLKALPNLRVMLALGRVAHDTIMTTFDLRKSLFPFSHGARHQLSPDCVLYDSFHCSRYNTNTGRLTPEMFGSVFTAIAAELERS